jgi:hypothetical protein
MEVGRVSLPTPPSIPLPGPRALPGGNQDGFRAAYEVIDQQARRAQSEIQREGQRPVRESERMAQPQAQASVIGRIEFVVVDDAKVMRVLDSKEVLIYQMPSKGQLTLLRAAENAEKRAEVMA